MAGLEEDEVVNLGLKLLRSIHIINIIQLLGSAITYNIERALLLQIDYRFEHF